MPKEVEEKINKLYNKRIQVIKFGSKTILDSLDDLINEP